MSENQSAQVAEVIAQMRIDATDSQITNAELEWLAQKRILDAKKYVESEKANGNSRPDIQAMIADWESAYKWLKDAYNASNEAVSQAASKEAKQLRAELDAGGAVPVKAQAQQPKATDAGVARESAVTQVPPAARKAETPGTAPVSAPVQEGKKPDSAPSAPAPAEAGKKNPAPAKPADGKLVDTADKGKSKPETKLQADSGNPEELRNKIRNLTQQERDQIAASLDVIGKLPVVGEFLKAIIEVFVLGKKPSDSKDGQKRLELVDAGNPTVWLEKILARKTADKSKNLLEGALPELADPKATPKSEDGKRLLADLSAVLGKSDEIDIAGKKEPVYGEKMTAEVVRLRKEYKMEGTGMVDRAFLERHLAELKKTKPADAAPAAAESQPKAPETGKVAVDKANLRDANGKVIGTATKNNPVTILDGGEPKAVSIAKDGKKQSVEMIHVKVGEKDGYIAKNLVKIDQPAAPAVQQKEPAPKAAPAATKAPATAPKPSK